MSNLYVHQFNQLKTYLDSKDLYRASEIITALKNDNLAKAAQKLLNAYVERFETLQYKTVQAESLGNQPGIETVNRAQSLNSALFVNIGQQAEGFYGNHRSGWQYALQEFGTNDKENIEEELYLVSHLEKAFLWDPDGVKPIIRPWIGILHTPLGIPGWYETQQSNQALFNSKAWLDSMAHCRGLITLSESHKVQVEKTFDLPCAVYSIKHPTETAETIWCWQRYQANKDKKLLQIGYFLRNLHAIYQLPECGLRKVLVKSSDMPYFLEQLNLCKENTISESIADKSVQEIGFLENQYYDAWLAENIVFLDLLAASANNTVLECIARATPVLVNKLPSVVEYLGEDYPLYYANYAEAADKVRDENNIKNAHQYLLSLPLRKKLSNHYFVESLYKLPMLGSSETVPHKVTVVTVVLNMPELLERTILSVLEQDYKNLEYIIVDGGSTDGTLDIINKYKGKLDLWISEPDKGIYDAMNKGGRLANGVWVNFLNAGDTFIEKNTVSKMFNGVTEKDDLVYGHTLFQSAEEEKIVEARGPEFLWQAMVFNHNSLFKKRDLLLEHPFSNQYKIVADSEFVIWCYTNGKTFKNVGFPINTYESGGYADMNSVMRTVERWKVVSDYKLKPQQEINDFYFQRLLWEASCKDYLNNTYKVNI